MPALDVRKEMITLLKIYYPIFCIGFVFILISIFVIPSQHSLLETVVDILTMVVLLVGMTFLLLDYQSERAKTILLILAPVAFLVQGYLSFLLPSNLKAPPKIEGIADIAVTILLFPSLAFNLHYSLN